MNVVVSLSSVNMYSQVFTLPVMEGKGLAAAVDLNVRNGFPGGCGADVFWMGDARER